MNKRRWGWEGTLRTARGMVSILLGKKGEREGGRGGRGFFFLFSLSFSFSFFPLSFSEKVGLLKRKTKKRKIEEG